MKKMFKYLPFVCFIISIILSFPLLYPYAAISEYTIYTRMTEIVLPPELVDKEYALDWTFFEFEYAFEIINPSGRILYIMSHNTNLIFTCGNLSFESEQYIGDIWGPSALCPAFTNHTIDPGITEGKSIIHLSVNDTLEALPNGNFTVWMILDDSEERHNYINFTSEIAVNGSNIQITHNGANETFTFPEEPTPTSNLPYSNLATLLIGLLVIILIKKRKRSNYSLPP